MENELIQPKKNEISWRDLRDFIATIPEQYLDKKVPVLIDDADRARNLREPYFVDQDIYIFDDNPEDCGTLEELKMLMEDAEPPFDEALCRLVTKKGTPFLWID